MTKGTRGWCSQQGVTGFAAQWEATGSLWSPDQSRELAEDVLDGLVAEFGDIADEDGAMSALVSAW